MEGFPPDSELPTLFLTVPEHDVPILRVDVYASNDSLFTDAIVWESKVFLGFESTLYVIEVSSRSARTIQLDGYFSSFYHTLKYLLVASASELLRIGQTSEVLWHATDLAIDGVVVRSVDNALILGDGEWDPPGGWKPFKLDFTTRVRTQ